MQCPFYANNVPEIEEAAKQEGEIIEIKEIATPQEAQNSPSSYGVFNLTNETNCLLIIILQNQI